MSKKKCMVFETLGKVSDLKVTEGNNNEMRLHGIFGVCGVRNQNNRVYDRNNYGAMVESLQHVIATEGCPGELEHPNTMNINLENVSHKIESIEMNEDGTITGTILLLNTPKGKIAQAIVEGGLPLYISSRGSGTITNEGIVTLSTIKTYDLVGTPGFSQAKLTLKENQTVECLNENAQDGNISWVIYENDESDAKDDSDDLLSDDDNSDDKDSDKKSDKKSDKDSEKKSEKKSDKKGADDDADDSDKTEDTKNNKDNNNVTMNDLKEAVDKLTDKVTSLEAELHVAKESLVNYDAIEKWITEEFGEEFKNNLLSDVHNIVEESINNNNIDLSNGIEKWITEEFASELQKWITEEYSPEIQNWITEEFAPEVQNWVCEEFAPEVQKWIIEEYSPEIQNWITEEYSPVLESWVTNEFAPVIEGWITEEFAPVIEGWITEEYSPVLESWVTSEFGTDLETRVNENVSMFLESKKADRLTNIDSLLESIDSNTSAVDKIIAENHEENKYAGVYVVEHMPAQYSPSWSMISEAKQQEIIRSSRLYDFTKAGVLESFWAGVDFSEAKPEHVENTDVMESYHNNIISQMKRLRKK